MADSFYFGDIKRNLTALFSFFLRFKLEAICLILTVGLCFVLLTNNSEVLPQNQNFANLDLEKPLDRPEITSEKYNPHCTIDSCFDRSRCSQFKVIVTHSLY